MRRPMGLTPDPPLFALVMQFDGDADSPTRAVLISFSMLRFYVVLVMGLKSFGSRTSG